LSPIFDPIIVGAAKVNVRLDKVSLSGQGGEVKIIAFSTSRQLALDYKKALEETQLFSLVDLPLSSFSPVAGGVTFSLTLRLK